MKYVTFTLNFLLAIFFLTMALLFISPVISQGKIQSYHIATGSMEPALPVGTYVFVQKAPIESLKKNTIIAFADPNDPTRTIIHRIIDIEQNGAKLAFTTKGDNNQNNDQWALSGNEIYGKFFLAIPYIGYLSQFMKTPFGFFLAIGIPSIIFAIFQIKLIKEGIEEEVQKRLQQRSLMNEHSVLHP